MTWYTASIIQSIKYKGNIKQETYPVYENLVLIEAISPEEALMKAEKHAEEVSKIDDQLQLNGKQDYMCFEGVRKLIEVMEPLCTDDELEVKELRTGVELSYSYMEVETIDALEKLSKGKRVSVTYIDSDEN